MPKVAWKTHPELVILRRGPYTTVENAVKARRLRERIEELRAPGSDLAFPWLQCRQAQLSDFWRVYAEFVETRELIFDRHAIEYWGGVID